MQIARDPHTIKRARGPLGRSSDFSKSLILLKNIYVFECVLLVYLCVLNTCTNYDYEETPLGNLSKQKGKRGENEFAQVLTDIIKPLLVKGDYETLAPWQKVFVDVQANGGDIVSIPGLSIEVKRHETLVVNTWWRQACVQADNIGAIPVLAYRQNRKAWRVCLPAYLLAIGIDGYLEVSLETFSQWLLHYLKG